MQRNEEILRLLRERVKRPFTPNEIRLFPPDHPVRKDELDLWIRREAEDYDQESLNKARQKLAHQYPDLFPEE